MAGGTEFPFPSGLRCCGRRPASPQSSPGCNRLPAGTHPMGRTVGSPPGSPPSLRHSIVMDRFSPAQRTSATQAPHGRLTFALVDPARLLVYYGATASADGTPNKSMRVRMYAWLLSLECCDNLWTVYAREKCLVALTNGSITIMFPRRHDV